MESKHSVVFHQSELPCLSFAVFEDMRKKGELCDLTIKVQNCTFVGHRVIIAAVIPFFRILFTSQEECQDNVLALGDLDPKALESLIDFAYTNNLNICDDNAQSLLMTSHFLQLHQVKEACVDYLSQRLQANNVVKVRTTALIINDSNFIQTTSHYIQKNFEEISKSEDFLSLTSSCLNEIISKDDLNISNEEIIFEAVMRWVRFSTSERHSVLPLLMNEVRMVYLSLDYLTDRVLSDNLIADSKPCLEIVEEAKTYHATTSEGASLLNLKTRPRKIDGIYSVCYSYTSGISVHYADFPNGTWHHLSSEMHYDVVYHVVTANEKIYVLLEETILTFHLKTLEWEELTSRHQFLCGAAVCSYDDIIYCFGSVHHDFRDKMRFFDTQQNIWLKERKMKKGLCNSAAATLGSYIYVTGGCRRSLLGRKFPTSSNGSRTSEEYSTLSRQWSEITSMLTPRERHGCVGLNGKLYVCGGHNALTNRYSLSSEVYDPLTGQWKYISQMKKERTSVSLVLHAGKIFAFGSNNGEDPTVGEIYDPEKGQWEIVFSELHGFRRAVSISNSSI